MCFMSCRKWTNKLGIAGQHMKQELGAVSILLHRDVFIVMFAGSYNPVQNHCWLKKNCLLISFAHTGWPITLRRKLYGAVFI